MYREVAELSAVDDSVDARVEQRLLFIQLKIDYTHFDQGGILYAPFQI